MKTMLLALLATVSVSAFADDSAQPQAQNRYNCFYQEPNMGYKFGAIASTEGSAMGMARMDCENFLNHKDLPGQCSFTGCRTFQNLSIEQ